MPHDDRSVAAAAVSSAQTVQVPADRYGDNFGHWCILLYPDLDLRRRVLQR